MLRVLEGKVIKITTEHEVSYEMTKLYNRP